MSLSRSGYSSFPYNLLGSTLGPECPGLKLGQAQADFSPSCYPRIELIRGWASFKCGIWASPSVRPRLVSQAFHCRLKQGGLHIFSFFQRICLGVIFVKTLLACNVFAYSTCIKNVHYWVRMRLRVFLFEVFYLKMLLR